MLHAFYTNLVRLVARKPKRPLFRDIERVYVQKTYMHVYVYYIIISLDGLMDRHRLIQYTHAYATPCYIYVFISSVQQHLDGLTSP
jgi:hypothetical protein